MDLEHTTLFQQAWKTAHCLHLPQIWHHYWNDYISALTESHVGITEGGDELVWAQEKHVKYSPKEGYLCIMWTIDH